MFMSSLVNVKNIPEFRNVHLISPNKCVNSFDLRASAIIYVRNDANYKYLMVFNNVANKYKHPGGHVYVNESLLDALKRELQEEIGFRIDITKIDINNVIFDAVLKMIRIL